MNNSITYKSIGIIRSPFKTPKGAPIQPKGAVDVKGTIILDSEYADALKDLSGFSHIIILYHFHLTTNVKLQVKPFLDNEIHGVFATRAPVRPNPIGLSIVRIEEIQDNKISILDVDVVDGTPLLDIKPHIPRFNNLEKIKIGWLEKNIDNVTDIKSDDRFVN